MPNGDQMSLQQLYLVLLAGGLVLLASIIATRAASRVGLPSLLLFLGVGVIVGEDGIGLHFDNYLLADHLGTVALAIILVEGGLTTRFSDVRRVLAPAAVLATVGVAVSMAVTAAGAHLLLGIDWQLALLLGAVVSVTDAAAVFSVLRVVPLPRRVAGLLEAESGFNDAPAVILVLMFSVTPLAAFAGARVRRTPLRVGRGRRDRVGLRTSGLNRLAPHRSSRFRAVSAGDVRARHGRVRRCGQRTRQRVPRRLPGRSRARQLRATPPFGHPVVRGGTRLAGADRPVRPARPARRSQRSGRGAGAGHRDRPRPAVGRPAAVGLRLP